MSYTPEEYAAAAARATAEQKELLIVGGELVLQEPAPRPLAELQQEAAATLWANYYQVKDAIEAAADAETLAAIDLAPDPQDVPPYTIRELNEEAAAAMAAQQNNQEDTP